MMFLYWKTIYDNLATKVKVINTKITITSRLVSGKNMS